MRFRTSKVHTEERNWSVILNPLRSELDKKRVSEKISALFGVSFEEARELVQSTPIILLDQLSHPSALQAQNIFQGIRAEVTLTSDPLARRRCYRAVWPGPHHFPFLDSPRSSEPVREREAEEIPADTAVQTVPEPTPRDLEKYPAPELLYEEPPTDTQELKPGLEEELKKKLEKGETERRAIEEEWEERYQNLKEEYQETKTIYEEKFLAREKEFESLKAELRELPLWQEKAAHLERQNKEVLERINHLESTQGDLERLVKERSEEVNLWREKYHLLAQKSERFEGLYEGERKRREQVEDSTRQAAGLVERLRRDHEIQMAETERWRKNFQELEENQKHLGQEFSQFASQREAEVRELREANQGLEVQLEAAQRQARELLFRVEEQQLIEKRVRLANDVAAKETHLRELVLEGERIRQEIQDRELQAQSLAGEQADLEREILEVKQAQRHLLEQNKVREKNSKLKRSHQDPLLAPGRESPSPPPRE